MVGSGTSRKWHWMPAVTFLIGLFSLFLFMWVMRINEKLRMDGAIVDAIMDVQIHTATYHLRLEEVISGVAAENVNNAYTALDQAIHLVDVILTGGASENDLVSAPLRVPEQRRRAEEIKSLLMKLKSIGEMRLRTPEKFGVASSYERQFEAVFKEILGKARGLELELEINKARNREESKDIFFGILAIWIVVVIATTGGLLRRDRQRRIAEEELRVANDLLRAQADELTGHREHLAALVDMRTAALVAANDNIVSEITERLRIFESLEQAEKQISELSARLIDAQEVERKRIAMGLHDELGQALTVTKLRIRGIEKGLREDLTWTHGACEDLLEYVDQVIENVRRLSLALSPTVLEDLGLTAALQWLISNLTNIPNMTVTSDIAEIDHLIQKKHWITIYRIVQEALTNIGKHAQAEHVSVIAQRQDDGIAFSIEDDGRGFDLEQMAIRDVSAKGFGLETMSERVRLLGGMMDIRSQCGKGTRVAFTISIEDRGA